MPSLRPDNIHDRFLKLRAEVEADRDAAYVSERRIREAAGWGRWSDGLAELVINEYLPKAGLRLWPGQNIRQHQKHRVLLYVEKSPIADVAQWATSPNEYTIGRLKAAITTDAQAALAKVRELVAC